MSDNGGSRHQVRRINPWRMFTGAMVPNWLLCRPELSQGAKLAYARLAQYAGKEGQCFPRQSTLAAELGVSDRMTRGYLHELSRHRLIEAEAWPGYAQNYFFLDHPWIHGDLPAPRKNASGGRKNASGGVGRMLPNHYIEENQEKRISTHTAARGGLPGSEDEAVQIAVQEGISEDFAREQFNHMEAVGWLDGASRPVRKWIAYLRKRLRDVQNRQSPGNDSSPRSERPGGVHLVTISRQLNETRLQIKVLEEIGRDRTAKQAERLCGLRRREAELSKQLIGGDLG